MPPPQIVSVDLETDADVESALADSRAAAADGGGGRAHRPGSLEDLARRVENMAADLAARQARGREILASWQRAGSSSVGVASPALAPAAALAAAEGAAAVEVRASSDDAEEATDASGAGKGGGKGHDKFTVACFNFGDIRRRGEGIYARNLYKLPVVLAFGLEVTPQHVRQFTGPAELWDDATEARPLERPPQGFRATSPDEPALAGREVSRWCASELYERCCVIGRASRVRRLTTRGRFAVEGKNRSVSRLLWVEVAWRMPMQGDSTTQVVVGHLHNSEAKRECEARTSYFNRLAGFCAGGARLLGMDLNMAIF
ncbi:MAG: hypothetical protein GY772_31430, partial [bacterium]|nr:hypothetical protein [bacterium]